MMKLKRNGRQRKQENSIPSIMVTIVSLCAVVFVGWLAAGKLPQDRHGGDLRNVLLAPVSVEKKVIAEDIIPPAPRAIESNPVEAQNKMPQGDFFRFTDRDGVIHLVNDPDKIPPEYRKQVSVTKAASIETPVRVTPQGHVLVPVTLSYRGRSVKTVLMLDTGASTTTISEETATELDIQPEETRQRVSTLADGRKVLSHEVVIDSVRVGSKELQQTPVAVLPSTGPQENHAGLLGMSFLKAFRYQVDLSGEKILWR